MSDFEIMQQRTYKVVKSNEIIQKARYNLNVNEIKLFSYIVSKIKPNDRELCIYSFTINEYCRVLGINTNDSYNIRTVKKTLKSLVDKSFYLTLDDGTETTISWFNKVWIKKGIGKIEVRLDDDLQKYLIGLYNNFTQYELLCTLPMQSSYSIRIYELLKSYAFTKEKEFDLEELKRILGCLHYVRFPDFRRKVLEIAIKEINEFTDLEISYEAITKGRKVIGVKFYIKQRTAWEQLKAASRAEKQIDGQVSIFDIEEQKDDTI